jgi:hypothetical protein
MIGLVIAAAVAAQSPSSLATGQYLDDSLLVFPSPSSAKRAHGKAGQPAGGKFIDDRLVVYPDPKSAHEDEYKPTVDPMPNRFKQPSRCGAIAEAEATRQRTAMAGRVGGPEYAVLRLLDGCMVGTPVGYHPRYLLPGAADPTSKPEDAPERRR